MKNYIILLSAIILGITDIHAQENDFEIWAKQKREQYDKWKKMRSEIVSHLPQNDAMDAIGSFIDQGFDPSKPNIVNSAPPITMSQAAPIVQINQTTPVNLPPLVQPLFKVWAVVVGVANYKVESSRLNYTDDDAYKMYAFYKSPEGGALPDEQITVLIDEDATRKNVIQAINNVYSKATENDIIVFYFSGHGTKGAFVTYEFDGNVTNNNGLLLHDELNEIFDQSKARYKYLIADACHSGSSVGGQQNSPTTTSNKTVRNYSKGAFYEAFENKKGGFVMLLSSMADEFSIEASGIRQGIFSYYLLQGLKGECDKNKDSVVSVVELFDYVNNGVTSYTKGKQNPILSGNYEETMPISVVR